MSQSDVAPWLSWRGFAVSIGLAVLLSWPMLLVTAPLIYHDTIEYYESGARIAGQLLGFFGIEIAAEGSTEGAVRAFAYSAFLYFTAQTPLGLVLTTVLQGALAIFACMAFVRPGLRATPLEAAACALIVGALSTLPWFVSYAMPDILGAILLVYYALLLRRIDEFGVWRQLVLLALATFAVSCHYGHLPLAAGLAVVALLWRLITWRVTLRVVALALLPIVLTLSGNLFGSTVALEEASVAPKRLPILLARSLADGPARWYLDEACDTEPWAICEVFDEAPTSVNAFLWAEDGLRSATPEQEQRIREEELAVLFAAFRAYPVAQLHSLTFNALVQTVKVGTDKIMPYLPGAENDTAAPFHTSVPSKKDYWALTAFDNVAKIGTAIGIIGLIVAFLRGWIPRPMFEIIAMVVIGLVANAAIFGGLSAPVDRYQSRVIWLLPVLFCLVMLERRHGVAVADPAPAKTRRAA